MAIYKEEIIYKESRIKILVEDRSLVKSAFDELIKQRRLLEDYIEKDRFFQATLGPVDVRKGPAIVKEMAYGAKIADVGPMAAVAGTIAELICKRLVKEKARVAVVENGGDIFAVTQLPISIGLFVGKNKLSGKIAFRLDKTNTPIAICSSSSFMGHSISFGKCDLATVFSKRGSIADAAATALANRVKNEKGINEALKWAISLKGVDGALAIKNDKIGIIGDIPPMIRSEDKDIKEKVTKDSIYKL